ncbi:MAG: transcriptional regulator FtrA [Pseudomonadota bacterium]
MTAPLVAALAYDRLCTFEYGLCVEVFGLSRPEIPQPLYRFRTIAIEDGPLRAAGGLTVQADAGLHDLTKADLILVPGWRGLTEDPPQPFLRALQEAHRRGARLASICSGVFVLAAAGLLEGRRAATHWRYADPLQDRYPTLRVDADVLYIDDGSILTSAGSAAGLDLCLHIVREDHGPDVANAIARSLVVPAHREGGQTQFIPSPVPTRRSGGLGPVLDLIRAHLSETWTVDRIASKAHMSRRTLLRRFRSGCGESPMAWLTRERISRAKDMLAGSNAGLDDIAASVGFETPETFRYHFKRQVGTSPGRYRNQFRA